MGRGAGAARESDVSVVGRRVISALGRSESKRTREGLFGSPAGINAAEPDQSTVVEQGAVVTGGRTTTVRRGGERRLVARTTLSGKIGRKPRHSS